MHPLSRYLGLFLSPLLPAVLPLERYPEKGEHVARSYRPAKARLPVFGFPARRCDVAKLVESILQNGEQIEHHLLVEVDRYTEVGRCQILVFRNLP